MRNNQFHSCVLIQSFGGLVTNLLAFGFESTYIVGAILHVYCTRTALS